MNKAHRDRIAFLRICSGRFDRNEEYFHVQGEKNLRLSQPQQMMARDRSVIDEAYAGDTLVCLTRVFFRLVIQSAQKVVIFGLKAFPPLHRKCLPWWNKLIL